MMKNVRWLYKKIGTTDISAIGSGTITGAISKLNTDIGNIVYPYGVLEGVKLYGFVSKKQMDATGSTNRFVIFIPTLAFTGHLYGVKIIKDLIVQGIAILRQNSKDANGFQTTNATQTNQGILISIEGSSSTPDIAGYICDCVFSFYYS